MSRSTKRSRRASPNARESAATRPGMPCLRAASTAQSPNPSPSQGPIPGSNWYACEAAERGGHRWTGPLVQTTLELPLAAGFDFEIAMHVLIDDLADLTVHIGDAELPLRRDSTEGRMHRIAFRIPAEHVVGDGLTALRFEPKKVFQPSADDLRLLSFLVRSLAVTRAEPAAASQTTRPKRASAPRRRPARK